MSRNLGKQPASVDPDEDVDDLDDVLDSMNKLSVSSNNASKSAPPTRAAPKPSSTSASNATMPPTGEEDPADLFGPEFAQQLQAGMEELLRELGQAPSGDEAGEENPEELKAMREAWEKMLIAGMDGTDNGGLSAGILGGTSPSTAKPINPSSASKPTSSTSKSGPTTSTAGPSTSKTGDDNFQDKIRQAMDKLKESEDTLQSATPDPNDPLAKLLADLNLNELGLGGEGDGENGGDIQKMLEGMMAQLMSKEILYDPLKELDSKYPPFLKDNASKLSHEDLTKYQKQASKVHEIVSAFEETGYSDDDMKYQGRILELMNEMQSYGSPPTEIMGEMPPGISLGADGMPSMDQCVVC